MDRDRYSTSRYTPAFINVEIMIYINIMNKTPVIFASGVNLFVYMY